jgi:predicted transcriptional regulator
MDPWKIYDSILEEWLPTKWTRWIAGLTSSIAIGGIFLPNFLQKIDIHPTPEQTLLIRMSVPPTICFVGTFIVLLLVVSHCKSIKLTQLQTHQQTKPVEDLDPVTEKILKLLFQEGPECSVSRIATFLSMRINTVLYHFDLLLENGFIQQSRTHPEMYELTPSGRKHIVENKTS